MSKEKLNIIYTLLAELLEEDINLENLNWNEIEIIKKMSELESVLRINKCEKLDASAIINLNDFVVWKLWSRDDVEKAIIAEGYEATEKNINIACNHSVLDQLGDCTDEEWDILRCAARESLRSDQLKEIKSYEDIDNMDEYITFISRVVHLIEKDLFNVAILIYNNSSTDVSLDMVQEAVTPFGKIDRDKLEKILEKVDNKQKEHIVDEINWILKEYTKYYPIAI